MTIKIYSGSEKIDADEYPVFEIVYALNGEEKVENLPMIEIQPEEDMPGGWTVNTKRLTQFQSELLDAFNDFCGSVEDSYRERGWRF